MQDTPSKGNDTLIVECYVRAKPSEVFSDLTDPDRLTRWWGDPAKWWLTSAEVDLRPGGRFGFFGKTRGARPMAWAAISRRSNPTKASSSLSWDRTQRTTLMRSQSGFKPRTLERRWSCITRG